MRIQDGKPSSGPDRTAIDRHAVTAAGQLLMSAIWLEHRVRRFSTRLSMLPGQQASSPAPVVSSSAFQPSDRGILVPDGRSN
jgi:hypothetical protein